ncbi:hypothetical protein C1645_839912 [Glomus cerebriforme]|uniref:Myb/SANT-like domain-containing protein n=1 Tax=Glomus cerebriforme TaxID=658196 RepID=A0A397S4X4_9GLOM|nr:hypothetical protein C1645_839912 [Glomus cerebriforme]
MDEQTRMLIDKRKSDNKNYHQTHKRDKKNFWEEIANEINKTYNTNYFTTTKAYKEGTKNKRSLVAEKYYEEFSTELWKEPATGQLNVEMTVSSNTLGRSNRSGTDLKYEIDSRSGTASEARTSSKIPRACKSHPTGLENFQVETVRNDETPDRKRFLGILSIPQMKINPQTQEEYALHIDEYVDMLKKNNSFD